MVAVIHLRETHLFGALIHRGLSYPRRQPVFLASTGWVERIRFPCRGWNGLGGAALLTVLRHAFTPASFHRPQAMASKSVAVLIKLSGCRAFRVSLPFDPIYP